MEQLIEVGLLPECDTRQNDAWKRYNLNDQSKRLIPSDGRVKIQSESDGGGQVDDSNCIAQIFVTHKFFLKYGFLSMRLNIALHCAGIVNRNVRNCGRFV